MKHNFAKSTASLVFAAAVLVGCGDATPSCDSGSTTSELKDKLLMSVKEFQAGVAVAELTADFDGSYSKLQELAKTNPKAKAAIESIDKEAKKIDIELSDIRPMSKDEGIKKITCNATIKFTGPNGVKTDSINYAAQGTDSGLRVDLE